MGGRAIPHKIKHLIGDVEAPSVTQVTSLLPKSFLERWWRVYGFEWADNYTLMTQERGKRLHGYLEDFLAGKQVPEEALPYTKALTNWQTGAKFIATDSERHLESKRFLYHGTPDLMGHIDGDYKVVDFKFRPSMHYDILLNEAAYAQMFLEETGEEIDEIIILRFNTDTQLMEEPFVVPNRREYLEEFLTLRRVWDIQKKAESFDRKQYRDAKKESKQVAPSKSLGEK